MIENKTYNVTTFGCQMNERDSEEICAVLESSGFVFEEDENKADFVLYNTCTVRENANNKIWGRLGYLSNIKKKRPDMKIALCGCMMQEPSVISRIKESYPFVDLVFGTHNIHTFPSLLQKLYDTNESIIDVWESQNEVVERKNTGHKYPFKSGVNIMYGCNNFCSYCIVPYVRGREKSRLPKDIIEEITLLAKDGVSEIMLLGQNVNSYGKTLDNPVSFSELLREIELIDGIERIRFMTSHPKDLSDELIDTMAASKKICRHLHLPLQSGSTRILKDMNRRYSKEDYLILTEKIKKAIPDISLTTDIIVGYPGETREDFLDTLDVVNKVEFNSAFTFIYSPRTGTPAAKMPQNTPPEVIKERFDSLLERVRIISEKKTKELVGTETIVLIEQVNRQDKSFMTGRMGNNSIVHIPGNSEWIGKYIPVKLTESKGFYYMGKPL